VQTADGVINTTKGAVELCLGLIGIMAFFMGLMRIAEKAGGINLLSRWIQPFFSKLFPEIPV
jgi:spore maturation protein SpmA